MNIKEEGVVHVILFFLVFLAHCHITAGGLSILEQHPPEVWLPLALMAAMPTFEELWWTRDPPRHVYH